MFKLGTGEWLVLACVAMVFMGPKQVKALMRRWSETVKLLKEEAEKID
ncbi:twin-arginine translocase TatA/TatE family subunit [Candidatus Comchoanobacter bicostacola]|uniref:Twin-arginine translocase TatA/TatE family subunit n=1 Tax=Candidatus Comchoanobacter bicostacola TaxID=2919598 RepID=A0ABY5DIR1_9GAMM|nr:twin-arginine translocase TatA/TatE family subunit [Candidatus Comchoanobacter bicostacola]UTC24468.1 twin-arginine translocase TatA/TatE family subunit [Candidatus Comchoanobacter bicostacola]